MPTLSSPISDDAAKKGMWIAIFVGCVIGLRVGWPRYGIFDVSTWNVMAAR